MLNKEKYKEELEYILVNSLAVTIYGDIEECKNICDHCEECIFYNGNCGGYEETEKWLNSEYKEPILTDEEKDFLRLVIKTCRNNVRYISKKHDDDWAEEYICISIEGTSEAVLPRFDENTMYKGMELGKEYTLEELGL